MTTNDQDDYADINNDIAIIGMAGRFPMAANIDEFWTKLVSSQDCITRFTLDELEKLGVAPAALADPNFVPAAGYIADQDKFDAHFFEMNPREAENLDPQHRVALEVAWQTLEHAGYTPESVNGSVGVFAGVNMSTYFIFNLLTGDESNGVGDALDTQISVDKDMFASRISYKLNLKGPSIALGTACSTSLVCIHLACQSLLNGESKLALAGGSHIATPNCLGHIYHEGGYSSKDGYCRSFDARGSGTIGSGGTCFVLLKRMEDALEDNDTIYAVIKGSAVNNDGSEKIGYTAPSISGQTNIIAEAQAVAGVEPDSIRFIEAHGTATELGDPIEFTALTRAFRLQTERKNFCGIGSVKSNIGHLGVAAGAASIVKAALALKHKMIPESLHFENPNPKLDIGNSPFYVIDKLERIEAGEYPARAGVSSLGIGGTNAHIILEEPPEVESSASREWQLLLLSAKTPNALDNMSSNLAAFLKNAGDNTSNTADANLLADTAYTLQVGRKGFGVRRAFVVQVGNLGKAADSIAPGKGFNGRKSEKQKKIVFMFPGGGTQYVNMARGLYDAEPLFAETIGACAALFKKKMGLDVLELIHCDDSQAEANTTLLQRPKNFFAALFAVEYSLAKLWMSWGVKPDALIGHSLGEYIAACIAGVFSLNDAVDLICFRGELFEKIEKGAMFSVTLPAGETEKLLIDGVSIATINDPGRCVVAGTFAPMQAFEKILQDRSVEFKRLLIDTAGHSPMVDSVLEEFGQFLTRIKFNKPAIPMVSNISGDWVDPAEICTPAYWKKHLRQTVRFSEGVATLLKEPNSLFLEVGPGNALCSFVRSQLPPNPEALLLNSMRHVQDDKDDACHLMETIGKLWLSGIELDWKAFYEKEQRKRIGLPAYPFERKRYWVEPRRKGSAAGAKLPVADWLWQAGWRLDQVKPSASAIGVDDVFMVFADDSADDKQYADGLIAGLRAKGARVIRVAQGEAFAESDQDNFAINAGDAAQYRQLLKRLIALEAMPKTIVHCWSLSSAADQKHAQRNVQLSFVYLAQALIAENILELLNIVGITRQRFGVLDEDVVDCTQALITGPANVIPYESPNIRFITIDTGADVASGSCGSDQFSGLVLNELALLAAQSADTASANNMVAWRNGLRFVRDYVAMNTSDDAANKVEIRKQGVYLITGGLGGVGMVHAQALAKYQARLVLLQRSCFAAPDAWDGILADQNADALLKEQIKGIRNLQALGAEVLVLQADVTDGSQIAEAITKVHQAFGAINGLVHCAGYGEFVPIKESSEKIIDAVLAPKVAGTDALLAALAGENLELVLLCSSMSAQTTGYGLVGYVSACAYLDAVAHAHRNDSKTRFLSINWDVWSTPQQAIKAQGDASLVQIQQDNRNAILPREGIEVIYRALASGQPQAIVSTTDFQQLLRKNRKMSEVLLAASGDDELAADAQQGSMSLYDRPSLSSEYVAPSTEQEKLLASIWQETLGIGNIGVNDNFFELGGESLLGVKIVVKAKKMGLFFEPKQMFKTPTIAQIVQGLGAAAVVQVDQSAVSGAAPCSPIQQQFLQTPWADRNHWNVGALLRTTQAIDAPQLKAVTQVLIEQHDALRAQFARNADGGWEQVYQAVHGDADAESNVAYLDLSSHSAADYAAALQKHCAELQARFDVEGGPVFVLAFFKGPASIGGRLAILAHHLVMDALSLGIVIEDLLALLALPAGSALAGALQPKTSSYKDFSLALAADVASFSMMADIEYWQQPGKQPVAVALPVDLPNGRNAEQDAETLTASLNAAQTQQLLQNTTRDSQLKINELLIAALAKTVAEWQKQSEVMIDVVHHGRPDLPALDLSRTVGWFGIGCPLPLHVSDAPLATQLLSIKSQVEAVPNKGLSLAWLRQWHPSEELKAILARLPSAAVSLNYIGQVDQVLSNGAISAAEEAIQTLRAPANQRSYQHDVVAHIRNGQLTLNWSFSKGQYKASTIQALLDSLIRHLQVLCETDWDQVLATSAVRDLSAETLALHGIAPEQIEGYCRLTAFQSEMHRLACDQSRQPNNVTQALSVMEGPLDRNLLLAAWQALIARHQVLRTRFVNDANGNPLQVVCSEAGFALVELDYSQLDANAQQAALQQLMVEDRQRRYDLAQAPALRLYWVTLDPSKAQFAILLSNHQIILDGWTSSLLARDLLACLMAIATGNPLPPKSDAADFSRYVAWLAAQDVSESEAYWRAAFAGYRPNQPLQSLMSAAPLLKAGDDGYAEQVFEIDDATLANIQECARVTKATSNAVFQAAWALTLAQTGGGNDIVYGVTVSGRSCDLDGITEVVGQCTNSLPVRIAIGADSSVAQLLQAVHAANSNAQANNLLSLTQIKALLGLDPAQPLYASNFIFENIPMAESGEAAMPIRTLSSRWVDGWQFPLRVFVVPEAKTWVRFAYDANLFSESAIAQLANAYQENLAGIIAAPAAPVSQLSVGVQA